MNKEFLIFDANGIDKPKSSYDKQFCNFAILINIEI